MRKPRSDIGKVHARPGTVPEEMPAQFGSGTCDECPRPLSIYNPHTTCNACRHRLTLMGTRRYWQRRKCVRRGAMLPDTVE